MRDPIIIAKVVLINLASCRLLPYLSVGLESAHIRNAACDTLRAANALSGSVQRAYTSP
jgi:hypothetical protein